MFEIDCNVTLLGIGEVSVCRLARSERSKAYAIHCVPWLRFSHVRNKIQKAIKQHFFYFRISFFILTFCSCIYYIYLYNKQEAQPFP